jgi:hypothetical protein
VVSGFSGVARARRFTGATGSTAGKKRGSDNLAIAAPEREGAIKLPGRRVARMTATPHDDVHRRIVDGSAGLVHTPRRFESLRRAMPNIVAVAHARGPLVDTFRDDIRTRFRSARSAYVT